MKHREVYPFKFVVCRDYQEMSQNAAEFIVAHVQTNPKAFICAASGSTPRQTYDLLAREVRERDVSVEHLHLVKLDEWLDLPHGSQDTCEAQLVTQLVGPLGLHPHQYVSFMSDSDDPDVECSRVQRILNSQGPLDLAILGLGKNGHLGFNEPAQASVAGCHVAKLTPESQEHPMVQGSDTPPSRGVTLGIGDILRARRILLLVNGRQKAQQMKRLLTGDVTTDFPASMLTLHHDVYCYCDVGAVDLVMELLH